jgi:hypothetical protein
MQMKLLGITSADFGAIGQQLIKFSIFVRYWRRSGTVHQLFIDFKKVYDTVRKEALCNILIEFGIHGKLVRAN